MDILKHSLAPITDKAWEEIEKEAKNVLKTNLTARKFVNIEGPLGFDFVAVDLGRLNVPENQPDDGVKFGIYQVQPLIEIRVPFELSIWELDNVIRGAQDLDLEPVAEAARKAAEFEEKAVYYGFQPGGITGIANESSQHKIKMQLEPKAIFGSLSEGLLAFKNNAMEEPYLFVAGPKVWQALSGFHDGKLIRTMVEKLINGKVIYSPFVESAFLVPVNENGLQLTIGQDFSIGYETHDTRKVRLYITESFTFRSLNPKTVIPFSI